MGALSAPRLASERNPRRRSLPVPAGTVVWQGGMVALLAGAAVPAAANPAQRVLGVAEHTADTRLPGWQGVGSVPGHVDVVNGCWAMDNDATDPVTAADLGAPCFVTDDHTVSRTAAPNNGAPTKPQAGTVFDVDDAGVWVKFS